MVQLVPMTEFEYQSFLERDIPEYAQEHVQAGNWHPSEALQRSRSEHGRLLPDGLATKGHYLFSIVDLQSGDRVGMLWFAADDNRPQPVAFLYNFEIYTPFRSKGYGLQALAALEEKVKELGLVKISLHVFGHNQAAQALYARAGFHVSSVFMAKEVG